MAESVNPLTFHYNNCKNSQDTKIFFEKLLVFVQYCLDHKEYSKYLENLFIQEIQKVQALEKEHEKFIRKSFEKIKDVIDVHKISTEERPDRSSRVEQFIFHDTDQYIAEIGKLSSMREDVKILYEIVFKTLGEIKFVQKGLGKIENGKILHYYLQEEIERSEILLEQAGNSADYKKAEAWQKLYKFHNMYHNWKLYILESDYNGHSQISREARKYAEELKQIFNLFTPTELLNPRPYTITELKREDYEGYLDLIYIELNQLRPKSKDKEESLEPFFDEVTSHLVYGTKRYKPQKKKTPYKLLKLLITSPRKIKGTQVINEGSFIGLNQLAEIYKIDFDPKNPFNYDDLHSLVKADIDVFHKKFVSMEAPISVSMTKKGALMTISL